MAAKSGRVKLDDYEFSETECIGGGGFGTVFMGENKQGTAVAVKRVMIKNEKTEKYVKREKKFMKECDCRNVIKIFADILQKPYMYFMLEYCVHGSLNKFYKGREGRVTFRQCLKFMLDIALGVQYLHCERNICHRDLKPANILVQDDDDGKGLYMKVGDFSLAREFSESGPNTASGNVGTFGWTAPEIPQGVERCRCWFYVDIFSLGLVFVAMVKHRLGQDLEPHNGMLILFFMVLWYLFFCSFLVHIPCFKSVCVYLCTICSL